MATTTQEVHTVKAPNPAKEQVVPYYSYARDAFSAVFGRAPSRNSLTKYVHAFPGFPVQRGGPYVEVPVYESLKRVYTTKEAMMRFFKKVASLEKKNGIHDADPSKLA